MAPLCKGSCRRSGLSGCFSLRLRTVMTLRDIPVFRSAYSASRNARAPAASRPSVGGGSFALPFLRTEPALRAAPVFRSAYFPQRVRSTLCSKTLDLQVRFAHPPMPHLTSSSSCSGVPHGLFMISHHRPCGRWCFARLIRQAETLELQLHSQPPSKRTALSELKRSCFRFAPLTLRCRTVMTLRDIPVFRSAYSASRNARAPAASRPSVGGGSFAPPCTPLSRPRGF